MEIILQINNIIGREILDSRGNPTVEVDIILTDGTLGRSSVPSGASTGTYEAYECRDGDSKRYAGMGVMKAVEHINHEINSALRGMIINDQEQIDKLLCDLDGTENKSRLGGNAILAVSLAYARASASANS